MDTDTLILSLGGSLICPEMQPNLTFLRAFRETLRSWMFQKTQRRAIVIAGGGGPARTFQKAARELDPHTENEQLDWIGIRATWLNGELVKSMFGSDCPDPLVTDPTHPGDFSGRVLVGAGWKPGFSTDFDAVVLAERFGARRLLNLSNIEQVYSADPKKDPQARPLESLSWEEFQRLVGTEWSPGANLPFDPVATSRARELGLEVIVLGPSLDNLTSFLEGRPFLGTRIG